MTTMEQTTTRYRVGDQPRDAVDQEWELFVRETKEEPLAHVGSVSASSPEEAYKRAVTLFGQLARDFWVCPAETISRYSTRSFDRAADPVETAPAERES